MAGPCSQSQAPSGTQAERAAADMEPEEQAKKINDLVQFIITADQKKLPIKKLGIVITFSLNFPLLSYYKILHVFVYNLLPNHTVYNFTYAGHIIEF